MLEWYYVIAVVVGPLHFLMAHGLPVAFSFRAVNIVGAHILLGGRAWGAAGGDEHD